jgi:hypothetical protein
VIRGGGKVFDEKDDFCCWDVYGVFCRYRERADKRLDVALLGWLQTKLLLEFKRRRYRQRVQGMRSEQ